MTPRTSTKNPLGTFEGHAIAKTTIAVTNAGDGLSEALKTEPKLLEHGEVVYVVLECEVSKVRFDPIKDTDQLARVHILRAGTAALMDPEVVRPAVVAQAEKNQLRREEESGVLRLAFEELRGQHLLGEHDTEPVPECSLCDEAAGGPEDGTGEE
jgi:hypothetical protein